MQKNYFWSSCCSFSPPWLTYSNYVRGITITIIRPNIIITIIRFRICITRLVYNFVTYFISYKIFWFNPNSNTKKKIQNISGTPYRISSRTFGRVPRRISIIIWPIIPTWAIRLGTIRTRIRIRVSCLN